MFRTSRAMAAVVLASAVLLAGSPQAPTADYYLGDDVYHDGAFMLGANCAFYSGFRPRAGGPQPPAPRLPSNYVRMGGYQQLVRGEPFRAKFRHGFDTPEPLVPGEPAEIRFDLPDVYHVFRPGHRLIVHVQSSWVPLVDRNPQRFMEIPKARAADFTKATQRVYHGSTLTLPVEWGRLSVAPAW